jgi:polyhydroxyalkanoate synthesis regulator phasin
MAFGLQKLAVLESKLDIYEDLSKEMLDKLERAVATISENSNRVAVILERHENRLNESDKNDQLIIKMLEDVKTANTKEHKAVIDRLDKLETRVNDLATFRWIATGIGTAAVIVIGSATFFGNLLTVGRTPGNIGGAIPSQSR